MSLEWWKSFFEIGGIILLFLTFIFGSGALITTRRINKRQAGRLREFDRQLTDARVELSRQQETTANAEKQAAEAVEKAEKERLARLRLESQLAPRRLSGAQRAKLVELLASDPGSVTIVSPMADGEAKDFADDFDTALIEAGWQTVRIVNRITTNRGVSVGTVAGTEMERAKRLSNALTAIGVPHRYVGFSAEDHSISPWFRAGVLYLVVDHKPEPSNGE